MDIIGRLPEIPGWERVLTSALRILLIIGALRLLWALFSAFLKKLKGRLIKAAEDGKSPSGEDEKRTDTLLQLIRQAMFLLLWGVGIMLVLGELGVDIGPILAGAGILGLAVGFGAQNLVRDVISGFFLILENQVRVGDVAVVNGTGGLVEKVNFRTIVLRDISGTVHVFPNGMVNTLSNMTREWSAYVFEIGVAYKEDPDRVMDIMKKVGVEMRGDAKFAPSILEEVEIFGVESFGDSAVTIKGRIKTLPIKQWEVGREYRKRLKAAFDREGVEIPFPHRSLYFGEATKPFVVQLMESAGKAERE